MLLRNKDNILLERQNRVYKAREKRKVLRFALLRKDNKRVETGTIKQGPDDGEINFNILLEVKVNGIYSGNKRAAVRLANKWAVEPGIV